MATAEDPYEAIMAAVMERHAAELVVDLAGVSLCDSVGIGAIVRPRNTAARQGTTVQVINPQGLVCTERWRSPACSKCSPDRRNRRPPVPAVASSQSVPGRPRPTTRLRSRDCRSCRLRAFHPGSVLGRPGIGSCSVFMPVAGG
ncbi:STAS domain-containing protein [Micromonospora aurantiaca (nom. illeg.)]|uniref:STAS domain-containing protein n=1 Tax=Micromonospora aurantiaca (nom. illeg.) TaxID=47850 RepID=UPI003CC7E840